MQRTVAKQVLFLILLAGMLMLVFGALLVTNVHAQDSRSRSRYGGEWDWDDDWSDNRRVDYDIRYNRVEGLYAGIRLRKEYWQRRYPQRPFIFGRVGYTFSAKEIQYQLGLENGFFDDFRFAVGGEYHRLFDTSDRWIIPDTENSLAAFLIKQDYHDFYLREGWSGYVSQRVIDWITLTATYHDDKVDSLEKNTNWALFGGKRDFRDNPPMDAGHMRSGVARLVVDTRNSKTRTTRGWYAEVEYETAKDEFGSDFVFDRLLADVRRYQPLGFGSGVDIRVRAGTSHGILPWHKSFHLGGISTLRGYGYKAFPNGSQQPGGNRMVLAQIEYRIGEANIPDELGLGLFDMFNFIVFADAGWAWNAGPDDNLFEGFKSLKIGSLKTDVGIALANRSGSVRFEIARRTDRGKKPFTFYFRINRPF